MVIKVSCGDMACSALLHCTGSACILPHKIHNISLSISYTIQVGVSVSSLPFQLREGTGNLKFFYWFLAFWLAYEEGKEWSPSGMFSRHKRLELKEYFYSGVRLAQFVSLEKRSVIFFYSYTEGKSLSCLPSSLSF